MIDPDVLVALPALVLSVPAGLLAHEWSHALALRAAGVGYDVEYLPDRSDGHLATLASCPWARVTPRPTGRESPWTLRVAALTPLALALPLVAVAAGYLPSVDHPAATAIAIGWLACAVPSPQDFSVAFYAHRVLAAIDADDPDLPAAASRTR